MRRVGTVSMGIRAPILREGQDVCQFVEEAVLTASKEEGFAFHDKDVIAVTESLVGRAQKNYATVDQMAEDVRRKFPQGTVGVFNPILSRNRFAIMLRAIARGSRRVIIQMTYPSDEVGNKLISLEDLEREGIQPGVDVLTEEEYRQHFGQATHSFTGVDYVAYFRQLVEEEGAACEIIFANDPRELLKHTPYILTADIHSREWTKKLLKEAGAGAVYNLSDLMTESIDGSGYNEKYGLLGSNKATEERVKLFPRDGQKVVDTIAADLREKTGKQVEVMIYGDGAFKDPAGGIWELADPVVSPAYTEGLEGVPNELKLKYLADNDYKDLSGEKLEEAVLSAIQHKDQQLKGQMASEGTTPRRITDLLGSLADLTSGSGDKGTPIVLIHGYFDNLSSQED